MSTVAKIVIGVLVGLILVGICVVAGYLLLRPDDGDAEPTDVAATSTLAPGETEEPGGESALERIKAAGKMIVGTSADYPPFEFYVDNQAIDGFDIALMDEIGRRMGVAVEYHDFAFDGLGGALQLGQIDIAIAAISITPDREAFVDFTNVYFVGEDAVLARQDDDIKLDAAEDVGQRRIGAQRGSVYEDFLQTKLVDTGILPDENLFLYERAGDAVRDLLEDRIDLVMVDSQPAQVAVDEGGVKIVAKGLNQQRFAIALPKAEPDLMLEFNKVINDLHNEGYVAELASRYLNVVELLPTPTPAPTSEAPTNTPPPPPGCIDGMAFLQVVEPKSGDASTPVDMNPGQPFSQVWRVKNTGTCTWNSNYKVVYGSGNSSYAQMGGKPTAIQGEVAPGQNYDIAVNLVAPSKSGVYYGFWEMQNPSGRAFGERLPFNVRVTAQATVTPVPTQTPQPGIIFTVDRDHVKAGECVTFYWKVDNVESVYFYHEGQDWKDHGVVGEASQVECPPSTLTYYLRVVLNDGSVVTRQITIYVEPATDAPLISRFTVDPPHNITLGQCVTIQWKVEGQVNKVTLTANNSVLWDGAPLQGSLQDCPGAVGNMNYAITAVGPGGTSQGHHTLAVHGPATATPAPTAPPDEPVIYDFEVQPRQIPAGGCVNIVWSTGGGTILVDINRGENTILDDGPVQGSTQDCPSATSGEILYGVSAFNAADKEVWEQISVQIGP